MLVKQRYDIAVKLGLALALVLVLGIGGRVFADTDTTNPANTLKVSPVRTDVEIGPGESKTVQTTVTNLTNAPMSVVPIQNDFVAGDESGTPALILDADQYAPTHSLKRFMAPLATVTIPAKQSKTVELKITVPEDAQAGGYFGAIRFAPAATEGGGQVNLSASVASLVLMTVPGDAVEKINLTNFDIQQSGKTGSIFNSSNDLQATFRFENTGSVHIGPFGKVSVKQGDNVVYEADFNNKTPRDVILPDSARRWDIDLKNIGSFGHYTVSATFTYGTKNQTIEVTKSFWVIPLSVILITAGAIIGIVVLIVAIRLFLRSYKRRVLMNSRGRRRY